MTSVMARKVCGTGDSIQLGGLRPKVVDTREGGVQFEGKGRKEKMMDNVAKHRREV